MGVGEESSPVKPSKTSSSTQKIPATPSYADWSSSMQAYYGAGATPPFFAPIASPTPHPYLWGGQHPLMPPYGTPVPYPALYPPGGVYAHPNMAMVPGTVQATADSEVKATEGKERPSARKSRAAAGNPGFIAGKVRESGITASGSGNDGATQSAESGSEGSSEGSDENNNHELSANKRGSFEKMLADGASAQNGTAPVNSKTSVAGNPVSVPATNLNMSMDLWNPSSVSGAINMRPTTGVSPVAAPGIMNDQWVRDERELKRQKRKQSNRESARRSRLRKQAECEELQQRVETLSNENDALRAELQRFSGECEKLTSENDSFKEEMTRLCRPPECLSKLESSSSIKGGCGGEQEDDS